jgi:hypothetical protein
LYQLLIALTLLAGKTSAKHNMSKLALALLCAAIAVASARQLQQSPMKTLADLSADLQTLNDR